MAFAPSVLNIHTPTSSFALVHSFTQESLLDLYNKLSRKHNTDYYGERVGPGWLKYEYNDAIWNLDDDSDYTIFTWRHQQQQHQQQQERVAQGPAAVAAWQSEVDVATTSSLRPYTPSVNVFSPPPSDATPMPSTPTLHLHDPRKALPVPPAYANRAYYMFQPGRVAGPASAPTKRSPAPSHASTGGKRSTTKKSVKSGRGHEDEDDGVPRFKKQFDRFHAENGVRTIFGSIGPVHDVRMLLKTGYRHVYISRKFAIKHGFIPRDAAPGNYGYGGLVNLGKWPITLLPSATQPNSNQSAAGARGRATGQAHLRPDAFPTPSSTPGHTPVSSPGTQSHALPAHELAHGHSLLAPPMSSGKTRSLRSSPSLKGGQTQSQNRPHASANGDANAAGLKVTTIDVYLSEEPHFDVVLGRSFIEKRRIQMNNVDPTDVVCLDTGEKIECELVVLKDGRGEIVTVT